MKPPPPRPAAAALALGWRGALLALGLAILLGLYSPGHAGPHPGTGPPDAATGTPRIVLDATDAGPAVAVLADPSGRERLRVCLYRDGHFTFSLAGAVRATGSVSRAGAVGFGAGGGRAV